MNKSKTTTTILAVTAIIALILTVVLFVSNSRLSKALDQEKLSAETLLSEKLALQKTAEKTQLELTTMKEALASLKSNIAEKEKSIVEKEKSIKGLSNENSRLKKAAQEIDQLRKDKTILEQKIVELEKSLALANHTISDLNKLKEALEAESRNLKAEAEKLNTYRTDNYVAAAFKGKNDKLTIKASRTKKITLNFEIPTLLTEAIEFKVFTPEGKEIYKNSKELSWNFIDESRTLTASLSPAIGSIVETRRLELVYKPVTRLLPGTYKIELYSNSNYLGSCSVWLK